MRSSEVRLRLSRQKAAKESKLKRVIIILHRRHHNHLRGTAKNFWKVKPPYLNVKVRHIFLDFKVSRYIENHSFLSIRFSTCALTGLFWLLSHVIYFKLTKELQECLLSQASIFEWWITIIPKKAIWHFGKIVLFNYSLKSFQA